MQKVPAGAAEAIRQRRAIAEPKLEVVLGIGMKTLSNYTNHLAETPLDAQFQPVTWLTAGPVGSQAR